MTNQRSFKVGDVISMDELIDLYQGYVEQVLKLDYEKLRELNEKTLKFKIVELPEVD